MDMKGMLHGDSGGIKVYFVVSVFIKEINENNHRPH
jgi:hypothetical protein